MTMRPPEELLGASGAPSPLEGATLGDHRLTGLLGRGGSAEVWAARHLPSGTIRALKILTDDSPETRERFRAERRLLASVDHPGIVPILAQGDAPDGRPWFAMPLLDPLPDDAPERDVRRWALQLCDAADELHRHGILHRDIKRGNVMLRGRHAVLVDLGIAKPLTPDTAARAFRTLADPTLLGGAHALGTLGKSAPEQFEGAPLTPAADVYAIGILIRDLLPDWQRHPLWRDVLGRVLVADPALRLQTPRDLGRAIARGARRPWLRAITQWALPWVVVGAVFAWRPAMDWRRLHGWEFARAGFYAKDRAALLPRTVYATIVFTEPVTELELPRNPGGVVWMGGFSFARDDAPQRVILWSRSRAPTLAIGNVYAGACHDHEIVLVGEVDYHCTDIHGYVPYPTPRDGRLLGRPFSEAWVDHVRPASGEPVCRIRHVRTLAEARALPPPRPTTP